MSTTSRIKIIGCGLLSLSIGICAIGCNDESGPTQPVPAYLSLPFPWGKSPVPTHGQIYATARTNVGNFEVQYYSGGKIYSSTDHTQPAVDGGAMLVSGIGITHAPEIGYMSAGESVFGGVGMWGLAGNGQHGVPAFTDSMYLPSILHMAAPGYLSTISRAGGVAVQWNPDANKDSVVVGFMYDISASRFVDSTLPADLQYSWYRTAPDNGAYSIPASALNGLPVGGIIQLIVARGNAKLGGTSAKKFHMYGYTVAGGLFTIAH